MRRGFVVLFCACVSSGASWAVAGASSIGEREVIVRAQEGARDAAALRVTVPAVAARSDGGRWLTGMDGLSSLSADGKAQLHIDLARRGFGNAVALAADAYDGSAWVATDALLLLHFAVDGSLVHGTTVPAPANALAVDLDASAWVAAHDALMHFGRDGTWLEARPLDLPGDERVTALAVDALRDRIWVATTSALYRLARTDSSARHAVLRGTVAAMALDQRSGTVLTIVDESLIAVAEGVQQARAFDRVLVEGEQALDVFHDADAGVFVVETDNSVLRVANDGRVLERHAASSDPNVVAMPFRVYPDTCAAAATGGRCNDGSACRNRPSGRRSMQWRRVRPAPGLPAGDARCRDARRGCAGRRPHRCRRPHNLPVAPCNGVRFEQVGGNGYRCVRTCGNARTCTLDASQRCRVRRRRKRIRVGNAGRHSDNQGRQQAAGAYRSPRLRAVRHFQPTAPSH